MGIHSPSIALAEQPSLLEHEVALVGAEVFGQIETVQPLAGGSNPDVFGIQGALGRGVLKFFPAGSRLGEFEAASMRRASDAGLPVPAVLAEGTVETEVDHRPWIAMEYAAGKSMHEVARTRAEKMIALRSIGRMVAELHGKSQPVSPGFWRQVDTDAAGQPVWRFTDWHDYISQMEETLHAKVDVLSTAGLTAQEIDAVMQNISEYKHEEPDTTVFCHADLRLDHVNVDADNKIVSVIDWGSAQANGPEREFSKPLTLDDRPMIDGYAEAAGVPRHEIYERVRRMQMAHLPALVIFNIVKNRPHALHSRLADLRNLIRHQTM